MGGVVPPISVDQASFKFLEGVPCTYGLPCGAWVQATLDPGEFDTKNISWVWNGSSRRSKFRFSEIISGDLNSSHKPQGTLGPLVYRVHFFLEKEHESLSAFFFGVVIIKNRVRVVGVVMRRFGLHLA